ncbi:basic leucine zipper 10-like isoform X3 [Gossypium australe]|uniref:Basic leucine zipper 10-like isoform X3 n=1 Tax=Gossypium australe TaxID=47621 RepID=A0A5B6UYP2_9ROSI|nr:basic leucine zipper 10-like isoform X3 [Gossypium australe]
MRRPSSAQRILLRVKMKAKQPTGKNDAFGFSETMRSGLNETKCFIQLILHCNNERRDFTNPNLPTEQKGEPSQHLGYGDAGVGFPQMANATAIATAFGRVPIDAEEYRTILKNKIHQACAIVALSYASIVKAAGSSAQAENQVLQSGSDVQGPSKTQEQGEPDAGISAVSTTQKMSGTQVSQAISGINDRCTMMVYILFISIVCACCSSYVPEESVVLLENGALFLFDLAACVNWLKLNGYIKKSPKLNGYVKKSKFTPCLVQCNDNSITTQGIEMDSATVHEEIGSFFESTPPLKDSAKITDKLNQFIQFDSPSDFVRTEAIIIKKIKIEHKYVLMQWVDI